MNTAKNFGKWKLLSGACVILVLFAIMENVLVLVVYDKLSNRKALLVQKELNVYSTDEEIDHTDKQSMWRKRVIGNATNSMRLDGDAAHNILNGDVAANNVRLDNHRL